MFTFLYPWMFLLIPLPWVMSFILPPATLRQNALKVPFFSEVSALTRLTKPYYLTALFKKILAYLIWCLLVCALAAPQWLGEPIQLPEVGRDIMLAVDISGSMQLPDMIVNGQEINRLEAVKVVANEFIDKRQGDRVGLILFGTRAYLQTPLTFDTATVKKVLNDATIGLAGVQTAIGDAIGLAIKRLLDIPKDSRVLILLTDGANNSGTAAPEKAAELAAKNNIKIYTIGFGADELTIPGIFGPQLVNPSSDLDDSELKQIASLTGGQYFRAKDTQSLKQVYELINKLEPNSQEQLLYRPSEPLYPWPLATALLLSVLYTLHLLFRNVVWSKKIDRQAILETP